MPDNRMKLLRFFSGDTLKSYEIVSKTDDHDISKPFEPIGLGGSGVVFRALQRLFGETVVIRAIKLFVYEDEIAALSVHKFSGQISTQDFLAEVSNISSLKHEFLVKVIDAGVHIIDGVEIPFIVTDFVKGPTLQKVIELADNEEKSDADEVARFLQENPSEAIEFLLRLATVIRYVHDQGFAHCDIAPKNIFIDNNDSLRPILGDLGIMKDLNRERVSVFIAGSKKFMPPQALIHLNQEIDWATFKVLQPAWDIFAFCETGLKLLDIVVDRKLSWLPALRVALERGRTLGGYQTMSQLRDRIEFLRPSHRQLGRVPELSGSYPGKRRVLMPVGAPELSSRLQALIRHPAFERLARVPQITSVHQLFPGAKHDRYEHSLGVMEATRRYILALLDEPEVLEHLTVPKIELALVSALLYNLSRFPFSNIIHEVHQKNRTAFAPFSKSNLIEEIFTFENDNKDTLLDLLTRGFPKIDPMIVKAILIGETQDFDESDRFIYSILSSSLDARVIDFVRRDSLHTGISRSEPLDLDELLPHFTVYGHKLALRSTGVSAAEQVLTQRYWLFQRIYWNRPNRAYCSMVRYALLEMMLDVEFVKKLRSTVLFATEESVLELILAEAIRLNRDDLVELIEPLCAQGQKVYQTVVDLAAIDNGDYQQVCAGVRDMDFTELQQLTAKLESSSAGKAFYRKDSKAPQFLIDMPFEPGQPKLGVDIVVIRPDGSRANLTKYSPIVGGINQSFEDQLRRLRVFANPTWYPDDQNERVIIKTAVLKFLSENVV